MPARANFFFGTTFDLEFSSKARVRMRNRETTPLRMLIVEVQYVEVRRLLFSALVTNW